jgi:glycyl-tRNA synthetase beta subunit
MMALLHTIKNLKMIKNAKKIDNYFFNIVYNIYTKSMTGHTINAPQNQEFLSTMHTMIDDLDTISSNIDEHTYLRLVNGLQRLYNIHNTGTQTSSPNYETINRTTVQTNNEVEITRMLARHYGRVYDTSGVLISNEPYPINNTINVINSDANVINSDANVMTRNDDIINNNNNENNDTTNQQAIYTSYVALYSDAFDYWNQPQHRFRRTN